MNEPILHHYDFSNYSEKVRLVLGYKRLSWLSVTIPAYAPKPEYTPLTAGYRRTPALQIGADVYCDTRLIIEVIDALVPQPTLYPGPDRARSRALCTALESWAETSLMRPLALYITGLNAERFAPEFHADRARLHGKAQPSLARVKGSAANYRAQVDIQLHTLEELLRGDYPYVLPEGPSLADFALFEAPWFLATIGGEQAIPGELPNMRPWVKRVADIGHGQFREIAASAALECARNATPATIEPAVSGASEDIACGESVTVSPFDQYSPATGALVRVDNERITLASDHPATGPVHVHFPRLGYRLRRVPS